MSSRQTIDWPEGRFPGVIEHFSLSGMVAMLCRKGGAGLDDLKKVAQAIFSQLQFGAWRELRPALHTYFELCFTIDHIKKRTIGQGGSTRISNDLMQILSAMYAARIVMGSRDFEYLDTLEAALRAESGYAGWLTPKLLNFRNYLNMKKMTEDYASSVAIPRCAEVLESLHVTIPDLEKSASDMMTELMTLRKYGVKSSFFQDGMAHRFDQAWVVLDVESMTEGEIDMRRFFSNTLALVSLSPKSSITNLNPQALREESEHDAFQYHGFRLPMTSIALWAMGKDGQFDASWGAGQIPARDIFDRKGKLAEYELLRMAQIMRLYDLVVPVSVVAQMPSLPSGPGGIISTAKEELKKVLKIGKHKLTPDLIIPRLRRMENPNDLVSELLREMEEAAINTMERVKRVIGKHSVAWFVRRLPKGYRASVEAISIARAHEIELGEGETFVKRHDRGQGDKTPKAHSARRRP